MVIVLSSGLFSWHTIRPMVSSCRLACSPGTLSVPWCRPVVWPVLLAHYPSHGVVLSSGLFSWHTIRPMVSSCRKPVLLAHYPSHGVVLSSGLFSWHTICPMVIVLSSGLFSWHTIRPMVIVLSSGLFSWHTIRPMVSSCRLACSPGTLSVPWWSSCRNHRHHVIYDVYGRNRWTWFLRLGPWDPIRTGTNWRDRSLQPEAELVYMLLMALRERTEVVLKEQLVGLRLVLRYLTRFSFFWLLFVQTGKGK